MTADMTRDEIEAFALVAIGDAKYADSDYLEWGDGADTLRSCSQAITQLLAQLDAANAQADAAAGQMRCADVIAKGGLQVKPLEWEESLKGRWIGTPQPKLGDLAFWIFNMTDGCIRFVTGQGRVVYTTIEAAKAAAQADYTARIAAALEPIAPPDVAQAARVLLDHYDKLDCTEAVSGDFIDTLNGVIMLHGHVSNGETQ